MNNPMTGDREVAPVAPLTAEEREWAKRAAARMERIVRLGIDPHGPEGRGLVYDLMDAWYVDLIDYAAFCDGLRALVDGRWREVAAALAAAGFVRAEVAR
ncbi:hypothetical protein [Actinocorallia longicatena]|uniref:Uncharacterized protein n=1 Tax=Actinocorallia longicatena TaxID=111803 RepID=A0ABP6QAV2_9ACTN